MKLNPSKGDLYYNFSSDCIKIDSLILREHKMWMMRSFLTHGYIPVFLHLASLLPIIKDKLGSINSSKNYRSVCISSLFIKEFDWVVIILFGDSFKFHSLQFAYQPGVSATMCTWTVLESINYFKRNGSEVFACSMDKSKAFDKCKFSLLFMKLFG